MDEIPELTVLMFTRPTPRVIGRLDQPIHNANFASWAKGGSMDHPIKSGDDGMGWKKHGNLPL